MRLARPILRLFTTSSTTPNPEPPVAAATKKNPASSIHSIKELHARLIRAQRHTDPYAISPVVRSYALSPPHLHKARLVFHQIHQPTLLVFNYLLRGFSQSDRPGEAIHAYYGLMYGKGIVGDNLTFISLFRACARVNDVLRGQVFHASALKLGFYSYLFVSNALVHMYGCFRDLVLARKVFDEMGERDLVSWNSLICGYNQCGMYREVLGLFSSMQKEGVEADSVTMVKVLLACSHLGDRDVAESVVKYIEDHGVVLDVYVGNTLIDLHGRFGLVDLAREVFDKMRERNIVSWNAMITGYGKAGDLVAARKLFDEMPVRNVISWTSMITSYVQAKQFSDAVELFQDMVHAKVEADEITLASVLSACAHLGSLDLGETVHEHIRKHGVKEDLYLGNALIDMYLKCGVVEKALEVFHEMKVKDNVSWASVISGLAANGLANDALQIFSLMLREGVQPTHGSFIGVLLACAHGGLVDEGLKYFESMEKVHGLRPEMKHYGCVVDLLSRSGNLERAYQFIEAMPVVPDALIWRILLSACTVHGNVKLAEIAINKLLKSDRNSGNYVLLSNTYAGLDRWEDATRWRQVMEEGNVQKPSGWSAIEVNGATSNIAENLLYAASWKEHSI